MKKAKTSKPKKKSSGAAAVRPLDAAAFDRAQRVIPGGVDSPVRAFGGVGGTPVFAARGDGPHVEGLDGQRYVDFVLSWGPLILGHADADVVDAAQRAVQASTSFGMPCEAETQLAERIVHAIPDVEQVRFVNSGTEATMSAIRLARAATGRDLILKFAGCYHGHSDSLLVSAGSGAATFGVPSSPGVPKALARLTVALPFNDVAALERAFAKQGDKIAAVIVEPLPCNMGFVRPSEDFVKAINRLCRKHRSLLIADEVLTGFRLHYGGAYQLLGYKPDLVTLGKVIGGGMPVAAYGGPKKLMRRIAPSGPVYQAGTLSGNPVGMAVGEATLHKLQRLNPWASLERLGQKLMRGMTELAAARGVPFAGDVAGSIFGLFFLPRMPRNFTDVKKADHPRYSRFFHTMLDNGCYFAPSGYEVGFLSTQHTDEHIARALDAFDRFLDGEVKR